MAFKRTLAASVQAQAARTGGKGLPAASESEQAALPATGGASVAAVTAQRTDGAEPIATTVLPGFDLHVVGAPVERLAVIKFAEETGLSEEVLAQLFANASDDSAPLQFGGNKLAESIAGAIAQWIAAQYKQGDGSLKGEPLRHDGQLPSLEGDALSKMIAPALESIAKDAGASPNKLAEQLAADIKPVLVASSSAPMNQLSDSIVDVVKPSIALWLDSQSTDALAEKIARTITLRRELEAAVAQWVKASPSVNDLSVSDAWIRDAAKRVSPAVSEWIAAGAVSGRQADQLVANIAPQLAQALHTLGEVTGANSSLSGRTLEGVSVGLEGVSETQLRAVRDNVLSQPQPITLTVVGSEVESGRSSQQSLASALAQVIAPASRPAPEALALTQPAATLDRFALRGVSLRSDGLKAGRIDSVAALRELVSARSLELAKLASSVDKPSVPAGGQQTPFAGMAQGEAVDAAARSVGSSELSFRQSLASVDRALITDAGRFNQFAPNQNAAARELASRHLSEALGQRLAANIAAGHYRLTFNINPRELGAIDVVMEMRDGRLDAQINASNAVTRDLLGDSLPRLRDALQQSGINLAQLQVGSESQQGNAEGRQANGEQPADQVQEEMRLADMSDEIVSEDLELGLDLDSVDFWA